MKEGKITYSFELWFIVMIITFFVGISVGWMIFANHYSGDCVGYYTSKFPRCIDVIKEMCQYGG